ncbi:MAG: ABC transporter substrate binding protein [Clostridiaceae bacterium]
MSIAFRNKRGRTALLILLLMLFVFAAGPTSGKAFAHTSAGKNVLVIHSFDEHYKWTRNVNSGILSALESGRHVYTEYMDMKKINVEGYYEDLLRFQKEKYQGITFDVIICSDNEALKYIMNYGKEIFGNTPVVFCGINDFNSSVIKGYENITGVVENCDFRETIDGILKMQPGINTIFVLSTNSLTSSLQKKEVEALTVNNKDVDFIFKDNLAEDRLKDFNVYSHDNTAILMLADPVSFNGTPVPLDLIEPDIINGVELPVYVLYDFVMGNGYIGGKVVSGYNQGSTAGIMAEKILKGAKASDLPVIEESPNSYTYDYKVMNRFGIAKMDLPAGSIILNNPFSFMEEYRLQVFVLAAVFGIMMILIMMLIENIRKRRQTEKRFKFALQGANDAIWELNIQNNKFYASDKWTAITGYDGDIILVPEEHIQYIHPDDREMVMKSLNELKDRRGSFISEFRLKVSSGEYKWIQVKGQVMWHRNKGVIAYGYIGDISTRKKYEDEISFLAYYDKLTGLMNRASIMNKLDEKLSDMKTRDEKGAVYFVDLDDFKRVNDTLGHDYGDMLLTEAAKRLKECAGEKSFVGRLSGDEFLVIRYGSKDMSEISKLAYYLTQAFVNSFVISDKQIYVTASVGVTIYPDDGTDSVTLLKNADTAMYKAKQNGKNKFKFYNIKMYENILRRTEIEKELREVLRKNAMEIEYHPYVSLETGKITGLEALLRWKSEKLGYVSPYEFIPVAEETGLIVDIGQWALSKVCSQNMIWKAKGFGNIFISINVSLIQINEPNFFSMVMDMLKTTGLPPEYLGLEINESIFTGRMRCNLNALEKLGEEGVTVYLDDFGTGYSSLTYLTRIPLSAIKLDKSFTDVITDSARTSAIIHGIVDLAHKMKLKVVAEGVSKQDQYDALKELGCDEFQGFLFSKAMPAEDIEELMKKHL